MRLFKRFEGEGSSIVKVGILGAGQGKRLVPLTTEVPKALPDSASVATRQAAGAPDALYSRDAHAPG